MLRGLLLAQSSAVLRVAAASGRPCKARRRGSHEAKFGTWSWSAGFRPCATSGHGALVDRLAGAAPHDELPVLVEA